MLIPINLLFKKFLNIQKLLLIFCFFQILTETAFAQAGTLDSSFGKKGISFLKNNSCGSNIFSLNPYSVPIALQRDQKIIVAGSTCDKQAIEVFRINPNGSNDKSYGINGKVKISFKTGIHLSLQSISVDKKNRVVIGGNYNLDTFLLIRLNEDGSIDNSFGKAGIVRTKIYDYCWLYNIAIQPDNKIVTCGWSAYGAQSRMFTIARFNSNGNIDSSFGKYGIYQSDRYGDAISVSIQPDNKIIAAGNIDIQFVEPAVMRLNADGTLDKSFGSFGWLFIDTFFGNDASASGLVLDNNNKIIICGDGNTGTGRYIARLNTNGKFDSSFGVNGITSSLYIADGLTSPLTVQKDNKIIFGGYDYRSNPYNLLVARFNTSGFYDSSFGTNGIAKINSEQKGIGSAVTVQKDGKILLSGSLSDASTGSFIVSRFNASPAPEKSSDISSNIYTDNKIMISPNPVRDMLKIQGLTNSGIVTIVDLTGKVINKTKISAGSFNINVSSLSKGIYYVTITTINKNTVLKFLKD